jgi:hypothetical protein
MARAIMRNVILTSILSLAACGGSSRSGGSDGAVIGLDGAGPDATAVDAGPGGDDGGSVDAAVDVCEGYVPGPGTPCGDSTACEGVDGLCFPSGTGCCPVKMMAPRTCASDPDCASGAVCEEYVPDTACTFGLGTRCVPACTAGEACGDGDGLCDAGGRCVPLACPTAWTCPENFDCEASNPGADVHGCARRTCTADTDCECGACVNGGCHDGPGRCGFACACADPDTPIATPDGERAIADLRAGDLVYTVEGDAVVVAPLARVGRRAALEGHTVVRVTLSSGRAFEMSAGHPTADGRAVADVRAGDVLGGAVVIETRVVPYDAAHTYDILPASSTGAYFAAGALVGSTLSPTSPGD